MIKIIDLKFRYLSRSFGFILFLDFGIMRKLLIFFRFFDFFVCSVNNNSINVIGFDERYIKYVFGGRFVRIKFIIVWIFLGFLVIF